MEAHAKLDVRQAFIATDSDVTKIWKLLEGECPSIQATAQCHDGLVRRFSSIAQLLEYENPKRAAITAMEFSARSADREMTAEVTLGGHYSSTLSLSIRGEEARVAPLRASLADILDGMRPWYSRVATVDLFFVWFVPFILGMLTLQFMSTPSTEPKTAVSLGKALTSVAAVSGGLGLIAFAMWGIARLRKRLFPIATFAVGQGLSRHQLNEQIRWVVVVGFLVSIAATIVFLPIQG